MDSNQEEKNIQEEKLINLSKKEIGLLKEILNNDIKEVIIETSEHIDFDQKIKIQKELEKNFTNVIPKFKKNKNLISGVRIYVDKNLIDSSFNLLFNKFLNYSLKVNATNLNDLKDFIKNIPNNLKKISDESNISKNVGVVKSYKDGVIEVLGLKNIKMSQLIYIQETNSHALVMFLNLQTVYALVLSNSNQVTEGMFVNDTSKFLQMPVSDRYLGRVIDSLGNTIDGKEPVDPSNFFDYEKLAPSVMTREPVNQPLETGILAIDSLIPIGKGQRELIIGDRQTGKSTIAIDTIINQKNKNVICIYVAIGQRQSFVANLYQTFIKHNAMEYTTIVSASASKNAINQFLAPYGATALAEYFMSKGKDVLIVYDDLSKHAVAYREISLLLRRPPGREAYPGDIFYIHSRLLERSAKLNKDHGGGSITALPIIETQLGDVSSYIPTNVISITDGQIFLESHLYNKGILPAINVGISVSRVGSSAQYNIMKKICSTIKLDLATYYELESFSQFSNDLDENTKKILDRGKRIVLSLNQKQNKPYLLHHEIAILYAVTNGYLDNIFVENVEEIVKNLCFFVQNNNEYVKMVNDQKILSKELSDMLKQICEDYFKNVG